MNPYRLRHRGGGGLPLSPCFGSGRRNATRSVEPQRSTSTGLTVFDRPFPSTTIPIEHNRAVWDQIEGVLVDPERDIETNCPSDSVLLSGYLGSTKQKSVVGWGTGEVGGAPLMTMRTLPRLALIDHLGLGRPVFGPKVDEGHADL